MGGGVTEGGTGEKQPNARLNSWFARSGWSKGELARQVNRRARQIGAHHVSTDTSRVRRWLDGEQPREPIPRILSELFSERFGCVVAVEDLGLRTPHTPPGSSWVDLPWAGPQTVEMISEFSRSDLMLGRRGFPGAPSPACPSTCRTATQSWSAFHRTSGTHPSAVRPRNAQTPGRRNSARRLASRQPMTASGSRSIGYFASTPTAEHTPASTHHRRRPA